MRESRRRDLDVCNSTLLTSHSKVTENGPRILFFVTTTGYSWVLIEIIIMMFLCIFINDSPKCKSVYDRRGTEWGKRNDSFTASLV